ncbi:unnamed protein product [Spirodela intermedia]|uniref:Magnesium-dependent phosphatase 1 n=1 Tax=Spirodela intermedia TaxID=51605 RepID=A0ABN7ECK6_SPIIN|nr:unnamed protein product [Spirodela intermedia]
MSRPPLGPRQKGENGDASPRHSHGASWKRGEERRRGGEGERRRYGGEGEGGGLQILGVFQALPRLVVFDLDYTLAFLLVRNTRVTPVSALHMRKTVDAECRSKREMPRLYPQAKGILHALKDKGIDVAIASRSPTPDIAKTFLDKLGIQSSFVAQEIFSSWTHKTEHFQRIHRTGVPFKSMLFFDDEDRNIEAVSSMGVTSIYVGNGVNLEAFRLGLRTFARSRSRPLEAPATSRSLSLSLLSLSLSLPSYQPAASSRISIPAFSLFFTVIREWRAPRKQPMKKKIYAQTHDKCESTATYSLIKTEGPSFKARTRRRERDTYASVEGRPSAAGAAAAGGRAWSTRCGKESGWLRCSQVWSPY